MNNINANERGRTAFNKGKASQPMNDKQFVELMYAEVEESNEPARVVKAYYITEWKKGWNEAKTENSEPAPSEAPSKAKKKAKKKSKKKAK